MRVWRIAEKAYPPLDGEGARLFGARWNSPGVSLVYTAGSLSLAVVELLVHTDPDLVPDDLTAYEIELPEGVSMNRVDAVSLPVGWDGVDTSACRKVGDAWARPTVFCVLAVPSAILPEEVNYLVNPRHPEAASVRVVSSRPFAFDPRLLR